MIVNSCFKFSKSEIEKLNKKPPLRKPEAVLLCEFLRVKTIKGVMDMPAMGSRRALHNHAFPAPRLAREMAHCIRVHQRNLCR